MEMLDGVALAPPPCGAFLPAVCYTSPAFYAREMTHVFGASWQLMADVEALAKPGDYVTAVVGDEPIVVVRGDDGILRGFYNVCRHRGMTVAAGSGNCGKRLTCAYHGWTYDLHGDLIGVPERPRFGPHFDPSLYALPPIRVETWERFVFVCLAADTVPLLTYLAPLPEMLKPFHLAALVRVVSFTDYLEVNWKTLIDNAIDDYHVPIVHPTSIHQYIAWGQYRVDTWEHTNCTYTPLTTQGKRVLRARADLPEEAASGIYWAGVFPNLYVNAVPDGSFSWLRVDPLGPNRLRLVTVLYDRGDLKARFRRRFMRTSAVLINQEDFKVVRGVTTGIQSRSFTPAPGCGERERRTQSFQARLMQALAAPMPRPVAASVRCGPDPESGRL